MAADVSAAELDYVQLDRKRVERLSILAERFTVPATTPPGRVGLEEWLRWLAMKGKGRFAVWAKVIRLIILR
jgi:hypothetical protein